MPKITPWSEETEKILASMPTEGDTHRWFARVAARLAGILPKEETTRILLQCAGWVTHRKVRDREVHDAVAFGYGEVAPAASRQFNFPDPQPSLIGEVLGESSPICNPSESTGMRPGDCLAKLYSIYTIICVAADKYNAEAKVWPDDFHDFDAAAYQYICPNPLAELQGINQAGEPSVRCQSNIESRRFVVVEFDKEPDKMNQARLLSFLSESISCVMVVDSAGKSLHGWFPVYDRTESQAAAFFGKAVALGADQSIFDKAKLVRMPGGIRDGKRQRVVYFDGEAMP